MRNAQLASLAPDQSAGKTALQALPHVALYARPRVNHVAASSPWPPLMCSRLVLSLPVEIGLVAQRVSPRPLAATSTHYVAKNDLYTATL